MTAGEVTALLGPCGGAIAWVWTSLSKRIATLEARWQDCEERWRREVRRGGQLAGLTIDPSNPPPRLPMPSWEEDTSTRSMRTALEQQGLDEVLRRYADSTPPRR